MAKTPITVGCTVKVSDHRHAYLTTIVRETKTQWITEKGQRFNKGTLRLVGQRDPWTHTTIDAVTEGEATEFRAEVRRKSLAIKLGRVNWNNLDLETLTAVAKLALPTK